MGNSTPVVRSKARTVTVRDLDERAEIVVRIVEDEGDSTIVTMLLTARPPGGTKEVS